MYKASEGYQKYHNYECQFNDVMTGLGCSQLARLALAPPSLLARPPAASLHLGSPLLFQMTGEDRDRGQWDSII